MDEVTHTERLCYSMAELPKVTHLSRSRLYELIKDGSLPARKAGGRTLVLRADLEAFLNKLPLIA